MASEPDRLCVLVVYAADSQTAWQQMVHLPAPCSVADAIAASGFAAAFPDVNWEVGGVGIFGKRVKSQTLVAQGDRIEIYRELVFDPKESRRRRARHRQWQRQQQQQNKGTKA